MIPLAAAIALSTAVGFGAEHRLGETAQRAVEVMLRAVLWVIVPIGVFFNLAVLHIDERVGAGIAYGWCATAACATLAYLFGQHVLHLRRPAVGALIIGATLGNTGYFGLPVTAALFGFDSIPAAVSYDILVTLCTFLTVGFSIGAAFGTVGERRRDRVAAFFKRNPPLWAAAAAFLAPDALAPQWAVDGSQLLLLAVMPLGFFAVGVTLAAVAEEGAARFPPPLTAPVVTGVAIKMLVGPAVVAVLSFAVLDVPDPYLSQAAMASGINTLVLSQNYGLDRGLAAALIAWTTAIALAWGLAVALL